MGEGQDDQYAARRAEMEQTFHTLPPAGSAAYWQRIETTIEANALPLEVLARCVRERASAEAKVDAERVFAVIVGRIQRRVQYFARICTGTSSVGQHQQLAEEIEQECYLLVWRKLTSDNPGFLVEKFTHGLYYEMRRAAHAIMEREGIWLRSDVTKPTRVPADERDSIEAGRKTDEGDVVEYLLPDLGAEDVFGQTERRIDLAEAMKRLTPEQRRLIYDKVYRRLSEAEIAESLGLKSTRAVRYRLDAAYKLLREGYPRGGES